MPGALLAAGTTSMQRAAPIAGSAYTITFYMRVDSNPGDQREIFVCRNTGGSQFEGLEIRSTGVIRFLYVDGAGWSQLNTFVTMSLDTWWAFAITRDGDDLYCYAREDGGSTQSWSVNTSQASRDAWADLNWQLPSISHNENTGFQLTRLFDATMNQTAIEAEWDSETPVNTTDLVADWELANDGADATRRNDAFATYDLSGTGDADWGASDLPMVFGSGVELEPVGAQGAVGAVDLLVTRHLAVLAAQGASAAVDLLVTRHLAALTAQGATAEVVLLVSRLLAPVADQGSAGEVTLLVTRLLAVAADQSAVADVSLLVTRLLAAETAQGVAAEVALLVTRLLSVTADQGTSAAVEFEEVQEVLLAPIGNQGAAATVEMMVSRLLAVAASQGAAATVALLTSIPTISHQTHSRAVDTSARSLSCSTMSRARFVDTTARSIAA